MRAKEFITEEVVASSWIHSIDYEELDDGTPVTSVTLHSGKTYDLIGIDEDTFTEWLSTDSKGKFWWHLKRSGRI